MGLKKYEIITVGSDRRVRALRSWAVGGRYVNIGDVGGIVYDENTLSQDGACWLFRGNFGFPGARIGGDSIVDVGEAALSTAGTPAVDILGSSVVVGSKLRFESRQTAEDAVVLGAADFEQGSLNYAAGVNWEAWKTPSTRVVRSKAPIFVGGMATTIKISVPGYSVQAFVLDRDGLGITFTSTIASGAGVTLSVPAGQYFMLMLMKNPAADIVPADATAAQITFKGTYETKLSIIDSRVEINPAISTGTLSLRPGGTYTMTPGAKYPDSVIQNSKVSMMVHATADRLITLMAEFINTSAIISASVELAPVIIGIYRNVKNLTFSGSVTGSAGVDSRGVIQAADCDNFAVSGTSFPGEAAAKAANMPFIFQGCNVPNGRFQHDPRINNTYINIDFAKAQTDLNKVMSGFYMCSSNVEGMYRLGTSNNILGCLVESYESIKSFGIPVSYSGYNTTIYKDAYLSGLFNIAGTNVFGSTKKHDTQDVSGCKIVNTGATAVNMRGNIRVEGNATLTNCSVIGSGYFGGKAVASGLLVEGSAFMSDNASFTKTAGVGVIRNLKMTGNAYAVLGDFALNGCIHLSDNARFTPTAAELSGGDLVMKDNAVISGAVIVCGILTMKDNAKVSAGTLTAYGDVTLCGSYGQTATRTWTGKRTITDVNEPEYDNNVKSKYDL
jgi:hypothetical protein